MTRDEQVLAYLRAENQRLRDHINNLQQDEDDDDLSDDELKSAHEQVIDSLTLSERFALWITTKVGTMGFFGCIFGWTVLWLLWNVCAPATLQFDPAPAFVAWLFISNLIQILLMPLIMVGQNLQGKQSEQRAKRDLMVDIKSEKTTRDLRAMLEKVLANQENAK